MSAVTVITLTPEELDQRIERAVQRAIGSRPAATSPAPAPERTHLSVPEAARRVGLSPDTLRDWIASGRLAASRIGGGRGHFRVAVTDLEAAMRGPDRPAPVDIDALADRILRRRRAG